MCGHHCKTGGGKGESLPRHKTEQSCLGAKEEAIIKLARKVVKEVGIPTEEAMRKILAESGKEGKQFF